MSTPARRLALPRRTRLGIWAGRTAGTLSRLAGRGGGGTLPGWVLLRVAPEALGQLSTHLPVALVSGTNGKTTTTRLLHAGLSAPDRAVLSNHDGANLVTGLATTLARRQRQRVDAAVLEVDELALPAAIAALHPQVVVLLNLTRDQLDRVSEVARHVPRWQAALSAAPATWVVANADDPLVVAAVRGARPTSDRVIWVGAGQRWQADAVFCPVCAAPWSVPAGSPEGFACSRCDFHRPQVLARVRDHHVDRAGGDTLEVSLALPGLANVGNAVLAGLAAGTFGVDLADALERMRPIADVAGRYLVVPVDGGTVRLLLAKNPAGWTEALDQLSDDTQACVVAINAQPADGTDPSWLWDVPFELLKGRRVVAAGERAEDVAVRLFYAEVTAETVPDLRAAVRAAGGPTCTVLANYTAFAQVRRLFDPAAQGRRA